MQMQLKCINDWIEASGSISRSALRTPPIAEFPALAQGVKGKIVGFKNGFWTIL
jgi:hypothetical protein